MGRRGHDGELFGDAMNLPDRAIVLTSFDALRLCDSNGDGKTVASDIICILKL